MKMALYQYPKPNFSLNKVVKVLDRIQQYLTKNEEGQNTRVILAGVLTKVKPRNTLEKVTFSLLLKSTNDFSLEKIVNRNARESNTKDFKCLNIMHKTLHIVDPSQ